MEITPVQDFALAFCKTLRLNRPGVYLEVGANDGMFQSNTLMLERELGWSGVLVEASPKAFASLQVNRPNNHLAHAALVSHTYSGDTIVGDFARGTPVGKLADAADVRSLASREGARAIYSRLVKKSRGDMIAVPARTLDRVMADSPFDRLDFASLDVEGHEVGILEGYDLRARPPSALLIEMSPSMTWAMIEMLLACDYAMVRNVSRFTKARNPGWSQDHQDYLFVQNRLLEQPELRAFVFA